MMNRAPAGRQAGANRKTRETPMRNLNLLVLRCRDVERAKSFYELFGMAFTKEQHGNGPVHYSSVDDDGTFELYPAEGTQPDQTGLGFVTGEIEGLHTL